jgi:hypothetical protein
MDEPGPGGVPRDGPPSYYPTGSARVSRIGTFLCFLGALLIAVSFATIAIEYYQLFYGTFPSNINDFELYGASEATLAGFGLIFVGVGWVLDQVAVERRVSSPGPAVFGARGTVAFAVFLVGALCAAVSEFWVAYLSFAEYAQVPITPWKGTYPTFEALLAVGISLMALGWLARHLQTLTSMERRPR